MRYFYVAIILKHLNIKTLNLQFHNYIVLIMDCEIKLEKNMKGSL